MKPYHHMKLILASQSPRRKELLARITKDYEVMVCNDEEHSDESVPHFRVMDLARHKARAITRELKIEGSPDCEYIVIGSDTMVVCENRILGKPGDEREAAKMLRFLQDKTHQVITGVSLWSTVRGELETFYDQANVTFNPMTEEEISWYVSSGEPMDKAGAYAIQGLASKYIREMHGNFDTVVGLPVSALYQRLKNLDII